MRESKILDKTYEDKTKKAIKSSLDHTFNDLDNFIEIVKELIQLSEADSLLNEIFAKIYPTNSNICSKIRGFLHYSLNIYEQYSYQSANIDFVSLKKSKENIVRDLLNYINLNNITHSIHNNASSNINIESLFIDLCINFILCFEFLTNYILDADLIKKNHYITLIIHIKSYLKYKITFSHKETMNLLLNMKINSNAMDKHNIIAGTNNKIIQFPKNIKHENITKISSNNAEKNDKLSSNNHDLRIDQYKFDNKEALFAKFLNENFAISKKNDSVNKQIKLRLDQYFYKFNDNFQIIDFPDISSKYISKPLEQKNNIIKKLKILTNLILNNQDIKPDYYEQLLIKYLKGQYYIDLSIVKLMIHRCNNINYMDHDKNTILHFAVISGYEEIVHLLLQQASLNINIDNIKKQTPLYLAIKHNATSIAKLLIQKGARFNHS